MPRPGLLDLDGGRIVVDHLSVHPFEALTAMPRTIEELVGTIASACLVQATIRAAGSCWAPSDVAVADVVAFTDELNKHLAQPFPSTKKGIPADRLRSNGSSAEWLLEAIATSQLDDGHHLIHVEAGVKLCQLLADLEDCGLMLPTMGAGGGQSLAGVLSTASHGSDFARPPLSNWVRAIHLVASEGQEWWITGTNSSITPDSLAALPNWCADTLVVRDDNLLNAARVAMGRFGIIYSVVLEVVADYGLVSLTTVEPWSTVRSWMRPSQPGEPDRPIPPRMEYIHRGEDGEPIAGVGQMLSIEAIDEAVAGHKTGDSTPAAEALVAEYKAITPWIRIDITNPVGGYDKPLYNFNLVLSLVNPGEPVCWIERRWQAPIPLELGPWVAPTATPDKPLITAMYANARNAIGFAPALAQEFASRADDVCAFFDDPLTFTKGLIADTATKHFREDEIPAICARSASSFDALLAALQKTLDGGAVGGAVTIGLSPLPLDIDLTAKVASAVKDVGKRAVFDAVAGKVGGRLGDALVPKLFFGRASRITDTHDYQHLDDPPLYICQTGRYIPIYDYRQGAIESGRSCEFHFDASAEQYLFFIDAVMAMAERTSILGVIGVRFTPRADALLAMQIYDLNASVEIQLGRNRRDGGDGGENLDGTADLIGKIMELGYQYDGIPHWGLDHTPDASRTSTSYGTRLDLWKRCLRTLTGTGGLNFSTPYSRASGLEPAAEPQDVAFGRSTDVTAILVGIFG